LHEKDLPKHIRETAPSSPLPTSKPQEFTTEKPKQQFDEQVIKQLMSLGFNRDTVIKALEDSGGNADIAASLLFESTMQL